MPWPRKRTAEQAGLELGFRSGLERAVAAQLEEAGIDAAYESFRIEYIKPERTAKYTPDWQLPNGIIIETKGRFVTEDWQKHLLVKAQHPDLDVRFVFSNPQARISKTSATSYAMWCEKNGFKYAAKLIPEEWLRERRIQAKKNSREV